MAKQNKLGYLWEFSDDDASENCSSVADMKHRFANWLNDNDIQLVTWGRDYMDNDMDSSIKYSAKLLRDNPALMNAFGFDDNDLDEANSNTYSGTTRGCLSSCGYGQNRNYSVNRGDDFDFFDFLPDFLGRIPKWLWIFAIVVVIFTVFGDASFSIDNWFSWGSFSLGNIFGGFFSDVYAFFTGGFKKIISILIAGIISVGLLKADINCPLFVRILILFVIWVGVLNYDW